VKSLFHHNSIFTFVCLKFSKCSVFVRDFNFSGFIVIENSSVTFESCIFSSQEHEVIRLTSFCQTSFLNCQFQNVKSNPLNLDHSSSVFIQKTCFSDCISFVLISPDSKIEIFNCEFHKSHTTPLYIYEHYTILFQQTKFSDCQDSVCITSNSKIAILNCEFNKFH
jgi:hypothetical protein